MSGRVYLDWNASALLRPEARAAMVRAMDVVGNPSSVHAEGRAAKGLIEKARGQVLETLGASGNDIVFTSAATEAAALALAGGDIATASVEHECVCAWCSESLRVDTNGRIAATDGSRSSVQAANGETGVIQELPEQLFLTDAVQVVGKTTFDFNRSGANMALVSGHKFGAPKGVGALVLKPGIEISARIPGGGQEMGRRSGTENIIGIVGMGAAAQAAQRDLENGAWEPVGKLRDDFEDRLLTEAPDLIIFGHDAHRLPNVSNFAIPGWKGETQVMAMDLAGYAISAGSACSSGKVGASRVLKAMGFDEVTASSAIRVSFGPTTTEAEVMGFADTWIEQYKRWRIRAA